MSEQLHNHIATCVRVFGNMPLYEFLLAHGKTCPIGPKSYEGERGIPHQCYKNSTLLAHDNPALTYVEGKVLVCGLPIEHAWCVDEHGVVVDPTLDDSVEREYFGVPFRTEYVRKATVVNKVYGLLDGYHARKTLPKLVELGLDAGQQWLLDKLAKRRKRA